MVNVLPTMYNHYAFRSRTEARWAVFLDLAYIPFRYEYEGFDLGNIWYLPDFWLPEHQMWLEIKGDRPTADERCKAQQLAVGTGHPTAIFGGDVCYHTPGYLFLPQQPDRAHFPVLLDSVQSLSQRGHYRQTHQPAGRRRRYVYVLAAGSNVSGRQ